MIKVEKFKSIEEAFNKLIGKDKKYVVIRHELEQNGEIKEHSHDVDEYVVFKTGSFRVGCNGETRDFNLNNNVHAVFYPKASKHSLKNLGNELSYFVIRDVIE